MLESSRNVMAHGDAPTGKWRWNWRMQWVASTLHTTSEHGVSSITTADAAHLGLPAVDWTDAPHRADLNGLVRFARKTKSGFCACAVIFQTQSAVQCAVTVSHIQIHMHGSRRWTIAFLGQVRSGGSDGLSVWLAVRQPIRVAKTSLE